LSYLTTAAAGEGVFTSQLTNSEQRILKPAILSQTGTTGGVSFTVRPQKPTKNASVDLEKLRQRAAAKEKKARVEKLKAAKATAPSEAEVTESRVSSEASSASIR